MNLRCTTFAVLTAVAGATSITSAPASARAGTVPPTATDAAPHDRLQSLLDRELSRYPSIPGIVVQVISATRHLDIAAAAGTDDLDAHTPMSTDSSVRIASVTKTFTAAATLRLVEQHRLNLSATLVEAGVEPDLVELLRGDRYDVDAITVRQLLNHTSGIADFAGNAGGVAGGPYAAAVLADPGRHWTRGDQVRFAVEHDDPLARPGTEYHYSDTGYVLLGSILESHTGASFGQALRRLLRFDRLGLDSTYVDDGVERPVAERSPAHQYVGEVDVDRLDPSVDLYGGGGIVTTMRDLATFYAALFGGRVFNDPATLTMMTTIDPAADQVHGGLGVYRLSDAPPCWYHDAFWGVAALSCPDLDLTIAVAWTQAIVPGGFDNRQLLDAVAKTVLSAA